MGELLRQQGARFEFASARLEDRAGVVADIERVSPLRAIKAAVSKIFDQKQIASTCPCLAQVRPTHVLNAAGLTGRPNVDWCEDHKVRYRASSCLKQSLWQLQACHNSCLQRFVVLRTSCLNWRVLAALLMHDCRAGEITESADLRSALLQLVSRDSA